MGARADTLAKQFESRATEMTETLEKLTDADWKKVTSAEKWTVGVTAHHAAGAHEAIAGIIKAVSTGQSMPPFTMAMLEQMNQTHAREHANCTRAETLALHKKGAAAAATVVRGLSDAELDKSGVANHTRLHLSSRTTYSVSCPFSGCSPSIVSTRSLTLR